MSEGAPISTSAGSSLEAVRAVGGDILESGRVPQPEPEKQDLGVNSDYDHVHTNLKWWNVAGAIAHGVQSIIMVAASATVLTAYPAIPLFLRYQAFNQTTSTLYTTEKRIGAISLGYGSALFLFLSCVMHLYCVFVPWYRRDISKGIQPARWHEYAVSSSIMIALIVLLFGGNDLQTLVAVFAANAGMCWCGLWMEQVNPLSSSDPGAMLERDAGRVKDWSPFWIGCLLGSASWIVVFLYFFGGGNYDNIPGFVYGILCAYFVSFNTFPVNMLLQYRGVYSYVTGEKIYIILSLLSKSILAWLVFGGSFQPTQD